MSKPERDFRAAVRAALAAYMRSEGCSCCRNVEEHDRAEDLLAKLLRVPKYDDGSGYDFDRYFKSAAVTPARKP